MFCIKIVKARMHKTLDHFPNKFYALNLDLISREKNKDPYLTMEKSVQDQAQVMSAPGKRPLCPGSS